MTDYERKSAFYSLVVQFISRYALVQHILKLIKQNDFYEQDLWPAPGNLSVAATKVQLFKNIAYDLFEANSFYIEHLQPSNKEGKKYYGLLIKAKLLKLEKEYHAVKEELGVIGGSCYYKKEIWDKGPVRDKQEELKKTCPYYFCL